MHLSCPYAEDYTNQEYKAFFETDSSGNLTCRILLEYYFSDVAVSFLQNLHSNRKIIKTDLPNILDFIIECSNDSQDPRGSQDRQYSTCKNCKKITLWFIAHKFIVGHHLLFASIRRHSRDRCSQAFPVFHALPLPCIVLNANQTHPHST